MHTNPRCRLTFLIAVGLATPVRTGAEPPPPIDPAFIEEQPVRGFDINSVSIGWFGHGEPGVMELRNGTRYQLTWNDVEWIAKMVWGESMDGDPVHAASVIWSVMQRADLFWPSVQGRFGGSLTNFIRQFSQPIRPPNPRQPRIVAAHWDEIPVYARTIALAFAFGLLPNPIPGAVDFANRNQPVGQISIPLAWIGFRGPTTGNIFYARKVGDSSTQDYDWSNLRVVSSRGSSIVTDEAFERFGRRATRSAGDFLVDLVPGGRTILRRMTGQ